jgi:hypothetical protein
MGRDHWRAFLRRLRNKMLALQYAKVALDHWKQWLPKMTRELGAEPAMKAGASRTAPDAAENPSVTPPRAPRLRNPDPLRRRVPRIALKISIRPMWIRTSRSSP